MMVWHQRALSSGSGGPEKLPVATRGVTEQDVPSALTQLQGGLPSYPKGGPLHGGKQGQRKG